MCKIYLKMNVIKQNYARKPIAKTAVGDIILSLAIFISISISICLYRERK